jgi:hypothetical protein
MPVQGMLVQAMPLQAMAVEAMALQAMAVEPIHQHGGHRFRDFIIVVLLKVIAKLVFFS